MKAIFSITFAFSVVFGGLIPLSQESIISNKTGSYQITSDSINQIIRHDCTFPLSDSDLDEALKRLEFTLPKGWSHITGTPYDTSRTYAENVKDSGLSLQISAFYTDTTPQKCVEQQGNLIVKKMEKVKWDITKFLIYPDNIITIDNKSATMGVITGYGYLPSKVPFQAVLVGILSNKTIFLLTLIASDGNLKDAEKLIEGMDEKLNSIIDTVQVD